MTTCLHDVRSYPESLGKQGCLTQINAVSKLVRFIFVRNFVQFIF